MRNLQKVHRRAHSDPAFKARLLSDPITALHEAGVPIPQGVTIKILEDAETVRHLVLPLPAPDGELSDAALEDVAGGTGLSHTNGRPGSNMPNNGRNNERR